MRTKIFNIIIISIALLNSITINCQGKSIELIHGITIYIDYPDRPRLPELDNARLDSIINGINYTEPTLPTTFRRFWRDQSRYNVDITHDIFYYTAPQTAVYYGTLTGPEGILMWKEALEYLIINNPGYDWNSLTRTPGGAVRSAMIISSVWGPAGVGASRGINWTLTNGVKINYIYASTLIAPPETYYNLFMTAHESGHGVFYFPDLYDTDGSSYGAQPYTIMSGNHNLAPLGPLLVLTEWATVVEPAPGTTRIKLKYDGDSVVVFRNIYDPYEFFTIEARRKSTIGNSLFPRDSGLVIFHSDEKVATSNTLEQMTRNQHYRHSVVQADGLFELEHKSSPANAGDIYVPGKTLSNTTIPNTRWWDGVASNVEISNIQWEGADRISFDITIPEPPSRYPEIPQDGWQLVSSTPSQAGYDGTKAFDGDTTTYFHVPAVPAYPRPHEIVIDLGEIYTINEFYYRANSGKVPPWGGRIADYAVYLSNDGVNWGSVVVTGKFHRTWIRQYTLFPEKSGRYLKFLALSSTDADARTSILEINLRGTETPTAISDHEQGNGFVKIFPTPAHDRINIEVSVPQKANVEIYNLTGVFVRTEAINIPGQINIFTLTTGMYILKVRTHQGTEQLLFIKN